MEFSAASNQRSVLVRVGDQKVSYVPETKKAIATELLLLHLPLLADIALYSLGIINWPVFMLIFYPVAMRIFIGNHDRYHSDYNIRLPRPLDWLSDNLAVVVTPWDEPHDSIRRKHLIHHASHINGKDGHLDSKNDPHSLYESGGLLSVIFSCLFYEEIQFFLDIRDGNLTRSRLVRFLIYAPILTAYTYYFGWVIFFGVFIAMRIVGFFAWFVFSWVIHQPFVYRPGFSSKVPKAFKWLFSAMHGRRVGEGCLHHHIHHKWPGIPYNQLNKFDKVLAAVN